MRATLLVAAVARVSACPIFLSFLLVTLPAQGLALQIPQSDRERGVAALETGDYREAARRLRTHLETAEADAEAWHLLAQALERDGFHKEAKGAVEKALKLKPDYADARSLLASICLALNDKARAAREAKKVLESNPRQVSAFWILADHMLENNKLAEARKLADSIRKRAPGFLDAEVLDSILLYESYSPARANSYALCDSSLVQTFGKAAAAIERAVQERPNDPRVARWRVCAMALRGFEREAKPKRIYSRKGRPEDTFDESVRIVSKPEPKYTEVAKKRGVVGTVILRTVFSAEGEVQRIMVMQALTDGLTVEAIKAARKIKFIPAQKDGKPVAAYVQLEYNFNLY